MELQRWMNGAQMAFLCLLFFLLGTEPTHSAEGVAPRSSAAKLAKIWRLPGGELLSSVPVHSQNSTVVLMGRDRSLMGVDLVSGKELWAHPQVLPEIIGYAVATAGTSFVVALQNRVQSLAGRDGAEEWSVEMPCSFMEGIRAERDVGIGYCTEGRWDDPHGQSPKSLTALDLRSGRVLWKRAPRSGFWRYEIDGERFYYLDYARGAPLAPHPGQLVALELRTGRIVWQARLNEAEGTLGIGEEVIVVLDGGMTGISRDRGRSIWRRRLKGWSYDEYAVTNEVGRAVVFDGALLALGAKGIERFAVRSGQPMKSIPYPGTWSSMEEVRENVAFQADGQRLVASIGALGSPVAKPVFVWNGVAWTEFAGIPNDADVLAVVGDYVIVRLNEGIEVYSLADKPAAKESQTKLPPTKPTTTDTPQLHSTDAGHK